jgi:hypothetical protein
MVRIIWGRLVTGCDWMSAKPERPWTMGSGFADTADGYVDQAGVTLSKLVGAESKLPHRARAEILHQHIGLCDELGQHFAAGIALHVDRQ